MTVDKPPTRLERLKAWSESPTPSLHSKPWHRRLGDWAADQALTFEGLRMKDGKLDYRGQYQPVAGCRVTVDSAGELQRRSTLTRTVAGALLFGPAGAVVGALFQKQVDLRELYLLVDGERLAWAIPVHPSRGAAARSFAAKVNDAAR